MSDKCDKCGGYVKHNQPGGCTCPRGYTGEPEVAVCMFVPEGIRWFTTHNKATEAIRTQYPQATRVRRWQENHLQFEDYMDKEGNILVQLEFPGPPVLVAEPSGE